MLVDGLDQRVCPGASLWIGGIGWAGWLKACGVQPGDRIAVIVPNGRLFVLLFLACLRLDAVFCPVSERLPADEKQRQLDALDAALVLRADDERQAGPHLALATDLAAPPAALAPLRPSLRGPCPELAVIMWSSGTSGNPRAIGLSAANLMAQVASHQAFLALDPASRIVSYLSWSHCFGFGVELLPALLAGAEIHTDPSGGRSPAALTSLAEQVRPTHLFSVPAVLEALTRSPVAVAAWGRLVGGVVGGAFLTPVQAERLRKLGWPLRIGYGQTECSPGIALGEPGDLRAGYLGRPLGCDVQVDEVGELLVRGPNVFTTLWAGPPPVMTEGWLRTGDLVTTDAAGELHGLGRRDDCFKLANGRMVNPCLVEGELRKANPGVDTVLVVGSGLTMAVPLVAKLPAGWTVPVTLTVPLDAPVVRSAAFWTACAAPGGKWLRRVADASWAGADEVPDPL